MKATVDGAELAKALGAIVGNVAKGKDALAVLQCVHLEVIEGGQLIASCSNMDQQSSARLAAAGAVPGVICVDAAKLAGFAGRLKGDVLLELDGTRLLVKCGRAHTRLATIPPDGFIFFGEASLVSAGRIRADLLSEAVQAVNHAVSNEQARHYLRGIFIESREDGADFTATDGHRLATFAAEVDLKAPAVIVPREAIRDVVKACEMAPDTELELHICPSLMKLSAPQFTYVTRLIDGQFPDWRRVLPRAEASAYFVKPGELTKAVQLVSASSDSDKTPIVRLEFSPAGVRVSLAETGSEAETFVDAEDGGASDKAEASTVLNSRYLTDALGRSPSEGVWLHVPGDEATPIRFASEAPPLVQVIMPARGR